MSGDFVRANGGLRFRGSRVRRSQGNSIAYSTGVTTKFYDGLGRLIEVVQPQDVNNDYYGFKWGTRYFYDLSGAGASASLAVGSVNVVAYGGLYKTQECIPSATVVYAAGAGPTTCSWQDVRGTSFDALSRPVASYELAFSPTTPKVKNTYDAAGQLGLLSQAQNALGQATSYVYDNDSRVTNINFSGVAPLAPSRSIGYDLDGRKTSVSDSTGAVVSYSYDTDGHVLSVGEPSTEAAASTICYDYYADGLRQHLSAGTACTGGTAAANGLSQKNLFAYSYRDDGAMRTQAIAGPATGSFAWTYTAAGRELTQSDPDTGVSVSGIFPATYQPKTYTYDAYGREQTLTLPQGFETSAMTYDADDELTGYQLSSQVALPSGSGTPTHSFTLSTRGELMHDQASGAVGELQPQNGNQAYSANGTLVGGSSAWIVSQLDVSSAQSIDARSGMSLSANAHYSASNLGTSAFAYDAAGRQTDDTWVGIVESTTAPATTAPAVDFKRTYDAENHLIDSDTGPAGSAYGHTNFTWGPDGHVRSALATQGQSGGSEPTTMHWDGDDLLFTTINGVQLIYVGKLAVIDSTGKFTVFDRDQTGTAQSTHDNISYSAWNIGPSWQIQNNKVQATIYGDPGDCASMTNNGAISPCKALSTVDINLGMNRSDGYEWQYGGIAIQGVRIFDPTSSQWLTPDAYAGDVHDPMSQKPFMWNGNNPFEYEDPSGYNPAAVAAGACALVEPCGAVVGGTIVAGGLVITAAVGIKTLVDIVHHNQENEDPAQHPNPQPNAPPIEQPGEPPVPGAVHEETKRGTGTQIWSKPGDLGTAQKDFDNLNPTNVRTAPNGTTVGDLSNGDTVNVRGHSTDSRATLEIQHGKTSIKVRYGTKPPAH